VVLTYNVSMLPMRELAFVCLLALGGAACTADDDRLVPSPLPSPTGPRLSRPALQLAVLDAIDGALDWCDYDHFPAP
jgi:hypothetical protein